ncbi:UDP-3-O-(3-hydroxymyristoyl)glucosamine N-acyltransferase [Acidihalobacter ferrooxydans]|uniref:UDP-3-O-acylglucosamine N-acyltransferase n=1 Tax=Acidihalobacter ferrooxydans TaxID=1765967 RepID=A0A1P8UHD3_9GAMM|nr:UDP-3-O-(3-hydroxymyristoyl)glucosamine N-acyltransferase [Acidihalobacter ferrooxydans]APZ43230.1 UDP-3-O-(3-hydroxymyristoyl)glucosamine N-acyltransferase [Acidihalobacter ferrooxydans]
MNSSGRTLGQLAQLLNARLIGCADAQVDCAAALSSATATALTFMVGRRHLEELRHTKAGAVLLEERWARQCPVPALIVDNPHVAFARALTLLYPSRSNESGIHPSATIAPDAQIAPTASIGPNVVISAGCRIDDEVVIGPGCVLMEKARIGTGSQLVARVFVGADCRIGQRCLVHPGVVIGADGFGLAQENGRWLKVPQIGRAVIGDDVEIGANTTIDRGAVEDTLIGDGVKLDNLIQIAHNVQIGENTAIAGCVGIAGSAIVGSGCTIGGGVGIAGHLKIADNVHVTGMSLVASDLERSGPYSSSLPAQSMRQWQKNAARLRHLDDMARTLKRLETEVATLRSTIESSDNKKHL